MNPDPFDNLVLPNTLQSSSSLKFQSNNSTTIASWDQEGRLQMINLNPVIKFKKLSPSAHIPEYKTDGSAGMDLYSDITDGSWVFTPGQRRIVPTGLAVAIPPGFEGQIRSRSGMAAKNGLIVLNAPGTVDADFRGELGIILYNVGPEVQTIYYGDRIAQLVICPVAKAVIEVVEELDITERGEGGWGSTGVK